MLHCLALWVIKQVRYSQVVLPKVLAQLSTCRSGGSVKAVSEAQRQKKEAKMSDQW
jgi:hypothetical protein